MKSLPLLFAAAMLVGVGWSPGSRAQSAPQPVVLEVQPLPVAPVPKSSASSLKFADHLFADGDFYRAITEYRRYLFEVKGQGTFAPRAACAIGEALFRGGQFEAAARQWDEVAQRAHSIELRWQAIFSSGLAYLKAEQSFAAVPRFRLLVEDEKTPPVVRTHARWFLAWGYLDAGNLEMARQNLSVLAKPNGPLSSEATALLHALAPENLPKRKNPLMAGLLSAVPGLGHFYLGQWQVGFTSLLWSGLFFAGAGYSALNEDYVVAGALGLVGLGWYSGGAYGAIAGALQHNRDQVLNWRNGFCCGASRQLPDVQDLQTNGTFSPGTYPHLGVMLAPTASDGVE